MYVCECLMCGHVNEEVDLEKTDGWLECEVCHCGIRFSPPFKNIRFSRVQKEAFQKGAADAARLMNRRLVG